MSLLFERAVRAFDPDDARELRADADLLTAAADRSVPLDHLARLVPKRAGDLAHPERDWSCVPLHEPDGAELSGECVGFERHPVRGPVFVCPDGDGEPRALSVDDAAGTALADRLRFWTLAFTPDERPSYAPDGPTTRVPASNPIPADEREAYFDRLAGFLEDERDAERERNRERARHGTPQEIAAEDDGAVPALTGFAWLAEGAVQCHVDAGSGTDVQGRYGVYEDDEVLLDAPGQREEAPVDLPLAATVERVTGRTLDLVPREEVSDPEALVAFLDGANAPGLSPLLNPVTYDREADAVEAVRGDDRRRSLVVGARDATFGGEAAAATAPRDRDLDDAQAFAAAASLYAEDACCLHGPPGTGKTRTLVEVVRRAVAAGDRVLVCADSNQGVDNVVVGESAPGDVDETSLHHYAAVADEFTLDRHHAYRSDRELVRETYGGDPARPDVVASTNNAAADFREGEFDLAVVDEATQATTPSAFIPFAKADRLVLAGDHKQLPPYHATTEPTDDDRYRSLFEHLYESDGVYGHDLGVLLTTQYRMHEAIAAFPNRAFYGGALENGADVPAVGDLPPLVGVDVDGDERADETGSYANRAEAAAVGRLVDRLLDAGLDAGDVGVVTPYRAQVDAVSGVLADRDGTGDVAVDTVDAFQGGERAAVVVSFVRSNDRGDVGFLGRLPDGPRRLNVALTRAERFLGLVGDWDTLRDDGNEVADLYRDLHDQVADAGAFWPAADD